MLCLFWDGDGAAQANGFLSEVGDVTKSFGNTSYKWTLNCGLGTNTRDELLGVWATVTLASRLEFEHLQVYGDSKIVID
jgi:ribonuclease HI